MTDRYNPHTFAEDLAELRRWVKCYECGGTGALVNFEFCPVCDGWGELENTEWEQSDPEAAE